MLYVNWRGSGYWRVICKSEGFRILEELYVNWRGTGYQRFLHKLEGRGVSENCA